MRKQLLGIILPLVIASSMIAAETQTTATATTGQAAEKHAVLKGFNVVRGNDGVSVEIMALGQVQPRVSSMDRPDRVVVDLPNTVVVTDRRRVSVDTDGVKAVRVGMNGEASPTTRVVVDLDAPMKYELSPVADKLVLKLHTSALAVKHAPTAMAPATVAAPQTAKASQEMPSKMAAVQPAVASKANADAPKEFVFVEPTYKPKDTTAVAPPARVLEAAAKFAEKPAADLLPKPSASLQAQSAAQSTAAAPQSAPASQSDHAINMSAEQRAQMSQQGSLIGPKYSGEPISVNLKDVDLKDFFRLVHEISGLNVVLDPAVKGSLTIVLDDVPWDQALDIVLKNNNLSRQLEGNVLN